MEDYSSLMKEATKWREMAKNLDGYQQRAVLGVARDCEAKARYLQRQSERPGPKPE